MTEFEKCMVGEYYNCHDKIWGDMKRHARKLLQEYNALSYEQKAEKLSILKQLFGGIGTNVSVNMNGTFVDCNKITIGDNVLIVSNVQLYTAMHPVMLSERLTPDQPLETAQYFCRTYALPIKIGNGCWLGGGVIVLPRVTMGNGSVIGAGSVVVKDIPKNSLAVGNPCHMVRKINRDNT